jgi:hypothetical protein
MQKYLTENEVSPEESEWWKPVTHQFIPSGSKYYAHGFLGMLDSLTRNKRPLKSDFGDDDRE